MSDSFNGLSPAEIERLAILMEEAGEVVQAVGKILRHGYESRHPVTQSNNRDELQKEIGDLRAAVTMMHNAGDIADCTIAGFEQIKLDKIGKYLHHQKIYSRGGT